MKCLRTQGLNVNGFKGEPHIFGYPEQITVHPHLSRFPENPDQGVFYRIYYDPKSCDANFRFPFGGLREMVREAHVVQFIASTFIDTGHDLKDKPVVMQHGGRAYRNNANMLNNVYNDFVDAHIIHCPDLLGLGAKNEHWIPFPVDVDFLQPQYEQKNDKPLIAHYGSSGVKGYENIITAMNKLRERVGDKFHYHDNKGNTTRHLEQGSYQLWTDVMRQVSMCDIYVETLSLEAYGRPFGEWGNAAVEAAAQGKIVISNSLRNDLYEKNFGKCGINIANSVDELVDQLEKFVLMKESERLEHKKKTRAWVERNHSFEAVGRIMWDKIYKDFF
jgi:glycosyltransferase involved in cell wall biosynthesis